MRGLILLVLLTILLLPLSESYASGQGDIKVYLNGGKNVAYIGKTNTIEVWIQNDSPIQGMSLAFEVSIAGDYKFILTKEKKIDLKVHGDAVGVFDMGGLQIRERIDMVKPDSVMVGGAAMKKPLPTHKESTLCYSFEFEIPAGQKPSKNGVCIDNIFYPPAGSWVFSEGAGGVSYTPNYQGNPNPGKTSGITQVDADAPVVCFDIVKPK